MPKKNWGPFLKLFLTLKLKRYPSFSGKCFRFFPVCFRWFSGLIPESFRKKAGKTPEKSGNIFLKKSGIFWTLAASVFTNVVFLLQNIKMEQKWGYMAKEWGGGLSQKMRVAPHHVECPFRFLGINRYHNMTFVFIESETCIWQIEYKFKKYCDTGQFVRCDLLRSGDLGSNG